MKEQQKNHIQNLQGYDFFLSLPGNKNLKTMKRIIILAFLSLVLVSTNAFSQDTIAVKETKECSKGIKTAEDAIIVQFLIEHKNYFHEFDLDFLKGDLESLSKEELKLFMETNFVNPNVNFAVSILTNVLGVDRFVIGQTDIGLLKLLTAGGLGVWAIIDWFQIKNLTQEYNFNKALEIIEIIKG